VAARSHEKLVRRACVRARSIGNRDARIDGHSRVGLWNAAGVDTARVDPAIVIDDVTGDVRRRPAGLKERDVLRGEEVGLVGALQLDLDRARAAVAVEAGQIVGWWTVEDRCRRRCRREGQRAGEGVRGIVVCERSTPDWRTARGDSLIARARISERRVERRDRRRSAGRARNDHQPDRRRDVRLHRASF